MKRHSSVCALKNNMKLNGTLDGRWTAKVVTFGTYRLYQHFREALMRPWVIVSAAFDDVA